MNRDILSQIIKQKRQSIAKQKSRLPLNLIKNKVQNIARSGRNFRKAISGTQTVALIAEVKKSSPSAGTLRQDFSYISILKEYEKAAVSAISILTEEDFFEGSMEILSEAGDITSKPLLAKDFFIDKYQIYEAKSSGADCILLITRILTEDLLSEFIQVAEELGMDCLVEVHNEAELNKAIGSGAELIGINNRNLENFRIDLKVTESLAKMIPKDKVIVSESGISTRSDVDFLISTGVDAILVGEALMRSKDISAKIRELLGNAA